MEATRAHRQEFASVVFIEVLHLANTAYQNDFGVGDHYPTMTGQKPKPLMYKWHHAYNAIDRTTNARPRQQRAHRPNHCLTRQRLWLTHGADAVAHHPTQRACDLP